jgi:hypothetical protein
MRVQVDETVSRQRAAPYAVETLGNFFTPVAVAAAAVDAEADGAVQTM